MAKKTDDRQGWFTGPFTTVNNRKWLGEKGNPEASVLALIPSPLQWEMAKGGYEGDFYTGLRSFMRDAGMVMSDVRFTYAVKYATSTVSQKDITACRKCLYEEIRDTKPKLVICPGSDCLKAVCSTEYPISIVRGCIMDHPKTPEGEAIEGVKVLAIHDLGNVKKNANLDEAILRDLRVAADFQKGIAHENPKLDIVYLETASDVEEFGKVFLEGNEPKMVCLDCEWHGKNWMDPDRYFRSIQLGLEKGLVAVIKVAKAGGERYESDEKRLFEAVKSILENPNVSIVGHNVIADGEWLLSYGVDIRKNVIYDTMLGEYIINQAGPFGLEELAIKYTPYDRYDVPLQMWVHKHKAECELGYGNVPDELMNQYAGIDVDCLRYIMDAQYAKITEYGMDNPRGVNGEYPSLLNTTLRTQEIIYELETHGMPVDRQRLDELIEAYQGAKKKLREKLTAMATALGFPEFRPTAVGDVKKLLFDVLKLKPVKTTSGKNWIDVVGNMGMDDDTEVSAAADKSVLEMLQDSHPIVKTLLQYRRIDTPCKTWLKHQEDDDDKGLEAQIWPDGALHSRFSQLTETGRFRENARNRNDVNCWKLCRWQTISSRATNVEGSTTIRKE